MADDGRVKLLLTYDPLPENREAYFNYVLGEFVPALEHLGLTMSEAWHTAYGSYPFRLGGVPAEDRTRVAGGCCGRPPPPFLPVPKSFPRPYSPPEASCPPR